MRILWVSDSPMKTSGYGCQTALIVPRLIAAGHEVIVYGLDYVGEALNYKGVMVIGANGDWHGARAGVLARRLNVDIIVSFKDLHAIDVQALAQFGIPWCPIVPVTTEPLSAVDKSQLRPACLPMAMARNGQRMMQEAGTHALYTSLAFDPAVFHPGDKAAARKKLGWPEQAFIALFVGANQTNPARKGIDQLLLAWSSFLEWKPEHRENLLFLHTEMTPDQGGIDIHALRQALHISGANLRYSDQLTYGSGGMAPEQLAAAYQAADVLINPCAGGGFELAQVEAQACGTPVIGVDWTAMRDTVWSGWKIGPAGGEPVWNDLGGFWFRPQTKALVQCLGEAYLHRNSPAFRDRAIQGAAEYAIDYVVVTHWIPALAEIDRVVKSAQLEGEIAPCSL